LWHKNIKYCSSEPGIPDYEVEVYDEFETISQANLSNKSKFYKDLHIS